jgi:thymidylate kinase
MTKQISITTKHYVYIHKDKETGEVLYVGKGSGGRAYGDWHQRPYLKESVDIEIVKEFDDKMIAFKYEEILTKRYHNLGEARFNKKEGERISEKTRIEFSEMYKGQDNPNYGNKWSDEQKERVLGKNNGMYGKPSPSRRKCKLIMPDGKQIFFNFVGEAYKYFKENFGLSSGKVKELLRTGEPYKTPYSKYKHLEGIRMEYILESSPKIIVISAVDRAGKDTLINEIDKQTKYKHMTMDRGPESFQAYCDIFEKSDDLKETYKEMEIQLAKSDCVLAIYIDCSTEELERRCIETNHEILDFDYHKAVMEFYFDNSAYKNKIKIDTTEKHVSEIVKELIEGGIL